MTRPLIGITLDSEEPGGYSKLPWYALRQNYAEAVERAGGLPVLLPHEPDRATDYLDRIAGLVVAGGAFDVDPAMFGATDRHPTVKLKGRRTDFEAAIVNGALARDMPVLGICGGQQLLNVVLGGTLYQHIPDEVPRALEHEQPNPRTEPGHDVAVAAGKLAERELILWPADRAPVVLDADLGPGFGEVVEHLGIDVGERLDLAVIAEVADGRTRRIAGVVPALEGDDEHR